MLTLLLLRHAKANSAVRGDDFARNLTQAGERHAGDIGDFLAKHCLYPDIALVSSAVRTSRTFELIAARIGSGVAIHLEDKLYNASDVRIVNRLAQIDADARTVMIVGHNPGIMDLAVELAQQGDLAEIERLRGRFPPCGLAVLSFDTETWQVACDTGGSLDALVFPEDITSGG